MNTENNTQKITNSSNDQTTTKRFVSTVGIANPKSNSLRIGLPKEVAQCLCVGNGEKVLWNVEIVNNEVRMITIEKL